MTNNGNALLLRQEALAQLAQKLHTIADALKPSTAVQTSCNSNSAPEHPKLMQYVCGTEHLGLASTYLEQPVLKPQH
ncbi:hypothetical protein H6F76_05680 [Leptolyngbya sp. FACHB-321]|uniref:hypothetical protein n=1 Tax=Leptolyngbya sp. FACHB-321 TaxID=2692807 RepID=UPI0016852309|nr:hypothetical protein [Leptolyngbya sp. FACHB-321]MBD2034523.1 hypothetical protein [Leptolyngbya sp. FACHB-321]